MDRERTKMKSETMIVRIQKTKLWLVMLSVAGGCAVGQAFANDAVPAGPVLSIRTIPAVTVVYFDHSGPYWSIGPRFAELRAYMIEHDQSGPMYARYLDHPDRASTGHLRTEVGFIVVGEHSPKSPYRVAHRGPELVATVLVESLYSSPARHFAENAERVRALGFEPVMPITEVFPALVTRGDDRIEVRFAVVPLDPNTRPAVVTTDRERSAESRRLPPQRSHRHTGEPLSSARSDQPEPPRAEPADRGSALNEQRLAESGKIAERTARPAAKPQAARRDRTDSPSVQGGGVDNAAAPDPPDEETGSIEADAIRLAEAVVPLSVKQDQRLMVWLGQVVYRVEAVARGIGRMQDKSEPRLQALQRALVQRYEDVTLGAAKKALASPTVIIEDRDDQTAALMRSVVGDLDRLLIEVGSRRLTGPEAFASVVGILERAVELVEPKSQSHASGLESP